MCYRSDSQGNPLRETVNRTSAQAAGLADQCTCGWRERWFEVARAGRRNLCQLLPVSHGRTLVDVDLMLIRRRVSASVPSSIARVATESGIRRTSKKTKKNFDRVLATVVAAESGLELEWQWIIVMVLPLCPPSICWRIAGNPWEVGVLRHAALRSACLGWSPTTFAAWPGV